ncbi:hypothetical protein RCO28_36750 [Streptomyces sp. LHD-70]|uniref:alpha/beta hydrolase n=1 Tax=Streptomyces sp. LHD-70 TaxID=3072140 RepID=UPI00280DDB38|nr:hypothetical protein [Streptomyces sp. LHD-70]MDQ8707977.1 hypothetical protein [Streptomyces sp. LHD-70]
MLARHGIRRPTHYGWAGIRTDAGRAAPVEGRRARPVVLYSPGLQISRTLGTSTPMELASRGYIVVTLDPTYEAPAVEFPACSWERRTRHT